MAAAATGRDPWWSAGLPDGALAAVPALALALFVALWSSGYGAIGRWALAAATAVVLLALVRQIIASLSRGEVGLDIIAALAMAGALVGEAWIAGAVVALMYAGGQALEARAQARAQHEMTALLARVPQRARVLRGATAEDIDIGRVVPGDRLLVAPGETVPVDGIVRDGEAVLDVAALTGEPLPVTIAAGSDVCSGAQNAGGAFVLEATARAADSALARIVALVDGARRSKAPMARLADRYALGFLAVTLAMAGGAWLASGEFERALAVLVVATPCPLILAVPVAIVAGMSHGARFGILIKSAAAIEALARCRTLLVDKTGTLTHGAAALVGQATAAEFDEAQVLLLAASLAQASRHVHSEAIVAVARARGLALHMPTEAEEIPGTGIVGLVDGRRVVLGQAALVAARAGGGSLPAVPHAIGEAVVAVGIDGRGAGVFRLADGLRADAGHSLVRLKALGFTRIVLVTGDARPVTELVARCLPVDDIRADVRPEGKLAIVAEETLRAPTLMVGDGINDAAALAGASVGLAMGSRGSAAAAEAADVVLLVDRFDRVPDAVAIAQRTLAIARESVAAGMALSLAGMAAAAAGHLPPLAGALLQEAIDVAVVLNALRALGSNPAARPSTAQSVPG